jgi:hypothetical protein
MAENSYKMLVSEDGFPAPARIPIPIYLDLLTGGFTSFTFCGGCTPRVLDLEALQIEYRVQSPCRPSCGLPTSYYTLSHEFFHTIQFTEYGGPVPLGRWLSEGSAGWAGYEVNKNESRWDPLVVSAWLGANGTTDKAPEYRSFDTAFLFAFLADFYGGHRLINAIVSHATTNATADELITSQLTALGYNKTFLDAMNEFGGAIVSGNFSNRDVSGYVLRTEPPIAAVGTWTGSRLNISSFTNNVNGFTNGDKLQVGEPFGIEYVNIRPASNRSLTIGVQVSNESCFRASLITHSSRGYSIRTLSPTMSFALTSPQSYDKIYLGFTRGDCTDSDFTVTLSPARAMAPETLYWGTSLAKYGLLIAVGVSIIVVLEMLRKKLH